MQHAQCSKQTQKEKIDQHSYRLSPKKVTSLCEVTFFGVYHLWTYRAQEQSSIARCIAERNILMFEVERLSLCIIG